MSLIINLREDVIRIYGRQNHDHYQSYRGSVMSGTHSEFTVLDTACLTAVIGVQFKPGGALPFLPLPTSELQNEIVSLDALWGTVASELREQVLEAETVEGKIHVLEQFLLARLNLLQVGHPSVSFALRALQDVSRSPAIAAVTEQIGLSQTRFIQVFREAVGLTPKQYYRIQRFQEVLRLLECGEQVSWTDLALSCGYYDQAHFNHDFRTFSGLTPGAYLTIRGEYRNHVAL